MKKRRSDEDVHGLSEREETIVLALEMGIPPGAISREYGIGLGAVMVMQQRYIITIDQLTRFERTTRRSDAAYQSALAQCGGAYA